LEPSLQKSLERYDVLDRIAVGGMAEVFLAKAYGAHGFEKTLAIKRILPELAQNPEFEARFIAEAKVSVRLSHANIVQVLDFGRIGESLFIAMEYVDGLDLAAMQRKFKDEGRLIPLPAAFHIAIETLRAIDYAHQHNVVHRDVSPSNILISRAGEVKIADFGIAIAAQPNRGGIGVGPKKVMGKWRYMSPEQTRGEPLDTRSDLFSAAVVMFEMFTGEKLFPGDEADDIIKNIDKMPIPRMSAMRSAIPSRLDEVLAPALARKPIDRPGRPAQLLRALIELSYESSIMATALDVAEALATVLPAKYPPGRGALDDVIRRQLGEEQDKSVARRTAVTSNQPPRTATNETAARENAGGERNNDVSTGLFRKLDDDGLARLELDPTSIRHTEPMEKPELSGMHKIFQASLERDRNTEVGAPPSSPFAKIDGGSSTKLPTAEGTSSGKAKKDRTAPRPKQRNNTRVVIGAVIAVGVVGGVALAVLQNGKHDPTGAPVADAQVVATDTSGALEVDSTPSGATITVDGATVGIGPQRVLVAAKQKHHVTIARPGYVTFDDDVMPDSGKTLVMKPALTAAPALAHVVTTPAGAQVSLHDQVLGVTPLATKGLVAEVGADLVLSKAGYDTAHVKVDLRAGETAEVAETLKEQQKFGYVTVAVTGAVGWANVYADGQALGKNSTLKGLTQFRLAVGHHHLRLVNDARGHHERDVDVDVGADNTKAVQVSLN
jgi:serine/threonine protein kinase